MEALFSWYAQHGKERLQLEQWMSEMYDRREPNPLPAGIVEALYGEKTWASITTAWKNMRPAPMHIF